MSQREEGWKKKNNNRAKLNMFFPADAKSDASLRWRNSQRQSLSYGRRVFAGPQWGDICGESALVVCGRSLTNEGPV